ncbi:putative cofD-like protein [Salsuginibacillus halophilus]|uniref:Gluconeogenesis factor n=1 Tax=Salsuginibacillus halophilus TaxID=517424 RepID=A0A2P8HL80_9BACI|nr:YvcK family protein [Salsuginibacillus halophilus]PSL46977.1 putative cofD-like protein [Salsuginibacillus halophilus]
MSGPKIVVIGGGTGLSVLLRGMKTFPVDLTAIVTVADDGGSSGRLRKELQIPPPGDVRNVLVALAEVEPLVERMFQHRFEAGTGLNGHSLGNLLLAGMTSITGDFARGISELSAVLNVRGQVLPSANQSVDLVATFTDGTKVYGESNIPKAGGKIQHVALDTTEVTALPDTLKAIREADIILLGPGSLYTSVLPNLLVPGIAEEIAAAEAKKVYICNVMTQQGETDDYTAFQHYEGLKRHIGEKLVDTVLVNNAPIQTELVKKYAEEAAAPVACDLEPFARAGVEVIQDRFITEEGGVVRHDAEKVTRTLLNMQG